MDTNAQHKLFMLRLWRETTTDPWRIAIQDGTGAKPIGLPNTTALIAHLEHAMTDASDHAISLKRF